jgi:hypothetical protein
LTRSRIFGVYKEPDGSGFYAGLEVGCRLVWRSLTTKDEPTAERWMIQAHCHGTNNHHKGCDYAAALCQQGVNDE